MSIKPMNLLEILDSPIEDSQLMQRELKCYAQIRAKEVELGITEEVEVTNLPKDVQDEIIGLMREIKDIQLMQKQFSVEYRRSLQRLVDDNKGLPVHINAWDIHDHNIDADNIIDTYRAVVENTESEIMDNGSMLDFFTDTSDPVFATAPYKVNVVQLQSASTYEKTMGQVMNEDILNTMRQEHVRKQYGINTEEDYEQFKEQYLDLQAMENIDTNIETLAIVQQYHINDYIGYLHLVKSADNNIFDWGFDLNDTMTGQEQIGFGELLNEENNGGNYEFFTVVDFINKNEGKISYESTVITWLDKYGSPTFSRSYSAFDEITTDDTIMSHYDSFCILAVEKVFQWWNSDNDLLEIGGLPITPSVRKRLKKYNRKRSKKSSITYKTLRVKPSIKVVDESGEERVPKLREIAQHTRRGHWAHYGVNGKGLLFGKYARPVYRKPKTIGKLANGLVLKDYELEKGV